ncbi:Glutathione S-transferase Mu 1 [Galemys pyrenaicus]|uniref:glutathione transferase n=1 Tax=Galemys pyrenaicus TaxID=202257 RepID=A0A8J6AI66_GALPY|nr:Glutathione S-transferase Mu 1 [Galemys pyrenaicus]
MAMTLGYWDIRGLAHAIRMLLEYTDSKYVEKKYSMGNGNGLLGLLTQSNAILRYLARKHNLCGETEEEKIRIDILENQAMDTLLQMARVCYSPDFVSPPHSGQQWVTLDLSLNCYVPSTLVLFVWSLEVCILEDFPIRAQNDPQAPNVSTENSSDQFLSFVGWVEWVLGSHLAQSGSTAAHLRGDSCFVPQEKLKPEYLKGLPDTVKQYSQFLGKRAWFVGDKITYVDFVAYDILDKLRMFEPKCMDAFPNLKDFLARFERLPKISAYMKSSRYLPRPLFLKIAVWGNK